MVLRLRILTAKLKSEPFIKRNIQESLIFEDRGLNLLKKIPHSHYVPILSFLKFCSLGQLMYQPKLCIGYFKFVIGPKPKYWFQPYTIVRVNSQCLQQAWFIVLGIYNFGPCPYHLLCICIGYTIKYYCKSNHHLKVKAL